MIEVACDESGSEGDRLIGATTDVFAHASVTLDAGAAAAVMAEIRRRAPTPAIAYKANHVLREKNRAGLVWLLGELPGQAGVYLADKAFLVVDHVVRLLLGDPAPATALYRTGRRSPQWAAFLLSANNLMRARNRRGIQTSDDSFFTVLESMPGDVAAQLQAARPAAETFRARLHADPAAAPHLDPLLPAIAAAVRRWGAGSRPVTIVHDRQIALSTARIAALHAELGAALAGVRLVGSQDDPRIQVADLLAGTARKIASDELNGRGDPELTALLRPYVDPESVWVDVADWAPWPSSTSTSTPSAPSPG